MKIVNTKIIIVVKIEIFKAKHFYFRIIILEFPVVE